MIIGVILITLINCGALLEQQVWIYNVEILRLFLISGLMAYEIESFGLFVVSSVLILVIFTLDSVQRLYYQTLFRSVDQE